MRLACFVSAHLLLGLGLLARSVEAQSTLVVDGDQGPYFTIQDAIDLATTGDSILMYPAGDNASFHQTVGALPPQAARTISRIRRRC